jgi:hypothetical protein
MVVRLHIQLRMLMRRPEPQGLAARQPWRGSGGWDGWMESQKHLGEHHVGWFESDGAVEEQINLCAFYCWRHFLSELYSHTCT